MNSCIELVKRKKNEVKETRKRKRAIRKSRERKTRIKYVDTSRSFRFRNKVFLEFSLSSLYKESVICVRSELTSTWN